MAKRDNNITFKNCKLDLESMQIIETTKEDEIVTDIMAVLKEFSKYEGLNISIRQVTDGIVMTTESEE